MDWFKILTGLGFLSISGIWISLSLRLPFPSFARASKVGPGHFPLLVASLLAVLTVVWLIREHRGAKEEKEVHGIRLVPWYLGYAAYVAIMPFLGFVPSTFFLVTVVVVSKAKGSWGIRLGKGLLAAVAVTCLEWGIFQKWLGVPLPAGILGSLGR